LISDFTTPMVDENNQEDKMKIVVLSRPKK
jgi:hypothetical protein